MRVEGISNEKGVVVGSGLPTRYIYALVIGVYLFATAFTNAHFMADSADYVDSIEALVGGGYYDFWEFGHLLWRPLGWLLYTLCKPLTSFFVGDDVRLNVFVTLIAVNWLAGLLCVCFLLGIFIRLCDQAWIVVLVSVAFILSHGFLNFTQTGSSYIPGLSLLLLGLYILVRRGSRADSFLTTGVLAGLALAGAVCFWFPYILAIPAAVTSPLFFFDRRRWRLVISTALAAGGFMALAYGAVVVGALGIHSFAGFKAWMSAASHDTDIRGFTRMVFGLARSFIYMGNDGMIFKRYLLEDPFNKVTVFDLLRLSLWKVALFYLFLAAVVISLLISPTGRRILGLLLVSATPMILFAIAFDGGAIERYLPLYPAIFISLCACLCNERLRAFAKYAVLTFVGAMIITNAAAMAKPVLNGRQDRSAARISDVLLRLKPNSRILVVTWQDDLINFSRSYPFHPINRAGKLRIGSLVTPGTTLSADWRQGFATQVQETWSLGGDMWLSRRALSPQPLPDWNWVEGDEKRVSWPDFHNFFSQIELGETVGGEDGFILVPPTEKNREFFRQLTPSN